MSVKWLECKISARTIRWHSVYTKLTITSIVSHILHFLRHNVWDHKPQSQDNHHHSLLCDSSQYRFCTVTNAHHNDILVNKWDAFCSHWMSIMAIFFWCVWENKTRQNGHSLIYCVITVYSSRDLLCDHPPRRHTVTTFWGTRDFISFDEWFFCLDKTFGCHRTTSFYHYPDRQTAFVSTHTQRNTDPHDLRIWSLASTIGIDTWCCWYRNNNRYSSVFTPLSSMYHEISLWIYLQYTHPLMNLWHHRSRIVVSVVDETTPDQKTHNTLHW